MLPAPLRLLLLLAPCSLLLALDAGRAHPPQTAPAQPAASRIAWRALTGDRPASLLAAAQQAAERARAALTVHEARAATAAMQAATDALADLPDAQRLPWQAWIDDELRERDPLALALYEASARAGVADPAAHALRYTDRTMPVPLRIRAHDDLWRHDPERALQRGHWLVEESPRGTTALHARYTDMLARWADSPLAEELLIEIAHRDALESLPRRRAIDALAATGKRELAGDVATIWTASTGDLIVRQRALLAALELDPALGERLLTEAVPGADEQPVLHAFVADLRARRGMPPLGQDG